MLTHSYTTKTANTIAATPANLAAGAPKAPTAALALADPETAAAVNEAPNTVSDRLNPWRETIREQDERTYSKAPQAFYSHHHPVSPLQP